jgi:transcriptional regulator with XRE-family HTH domain
VHIGEQIRLARKAAKLSQEGLARRADVSMNLVSRLERGEITDPHWSTLSRIAEALGGSVDDLMEGSPKALAR